VQILSDVKKRLREEKRDSVLESITSIDDFELLKDIKNIYPLIIRLLLRIRDELRKEKDYEFADYIRERLSESGIFVDDSTKGSTYRREVR